MKVEERRREQEVEGNWEVGMQHVAAGLPQAAAPHESEYFEKNKLQAFVYISEETTCE